MTATIIFKTSQDITLEVSKTMRVDQETISLGNEIIDNFNTLLINIFSASNILVDNEIPTKMNKLTRVKLNQDVVNYINQVRSKIGLLFQRTYLERLEVEKQLLEEHIPLSIRQAYLEKNDDAFTQAVMLHLSHLYLNNKNGTSPQSCKVKNFIGIDNTKETTRKLYEQLNDWSEKRAEIAKANDPNNINAIVSHLFNFCFDPNSSPVSYNNQTTLNNWKWLSNFLVNEFAPSSKRRLVF